MLIIFLFCALMATIAPGQACTDFQIKSTDKTIITARSMEWGEDMHSQLRVYPRQGKYSSNSRSGIKGLSWQSKYGYVGANFYGRNTVIDGMNEKDYPSADSGIPALCTLMYNQNNLLNQSMFSI